jgi:hypothetical protein
MSYSFHLNDARNLKYTDLVAKSGITDLKFVEGYPQPQNDKWPIGFTYIYRDKVTARSVEVEYDGNLFQVRIFTASSAQDYALAVDLVGAVAQLCNARILPEDQDPLSLDEFKQYFDDQWMTFHSNSSINAVLNVFGKSLEKGHQVSGVTGLMTIGSNIYEQIMEVPEQAADAFFYRLKKLNYINDEDVFQSPLMVVHDESSNTSLRLASWGEGVETLLYDMNTVVGLSTGESSMIKVALKSLPQLLGDKAQWVSEELLLVPAMKGDQWQAFLEEAHVVAIEDLTPYSFDPQDDPFADNAQAIETNSGALTADEMNLLVYAPIVVFCLVAGADRKIDSKEINAFQRELVKGVATESEALQAAMIEAIADFKPLVNHLLNDGIDINKTLVDIVSLLDNRLPSKEALSFKVSLLRIGTKVAEASGGYLGMFGDKVCKAEKQVLAEMAVLFGLMGDD